MSQLSYETDEPKKIDAILARWGLARVPGGILVEEVVTVLPKASTHCLVSSGRGATIVAFAGTDPLVLANWITDFDIHITKTTKAAVGYDTAAEAVWVGCGRWCRPRPRASRSFSSSATAWAGRSRC